MLVVTNPEGCTNERAWIIQVLLGDFLGVDYRIEVGDVDTVLVQAEGRTLELDDSFFRAATSAWLSQSTMPSSPLAVWDIRRSGLDVVLTDQMIPVLFGKGEVRIGPENISLGLDVVGAAFFMLSRYEEVVVRKRDHHDRFLASASVAGRESFLERPIVNEYVEILWACMRRLWPSIGRKQRHAENWITSDVDRPYSDGIRSPFRQLRQIGGDLSRRRDAKLAIRNMRNYFASKRQNFEFDPFFPMFQWMMDVNEHAGNSMTFFIKAGATNPKWDDEYSIHEPIIQELINRISSRGHTIGLHPSYETYKDAKQIQREAEEIRLVLRSTGTENINLGARQHYLRWEAPTTARHYVSAGLSYDATLGYADQIGFRSGTCYEYQFFDVEERLEVPLIMKPLVVMEGTLFAGQYMNLDEVSGTQIALRLRDYCRLFNGNFCLLWHNSSFQTPWAKNVYKELIC